jgi:hypothetical protein
MVYCESDEWEAKGTYGNGEPEMSCTRTSGGFLAVPKERGTRDMIAVQSKISTTSTIDPKYMYVST